MCPQQWECLQQWGKCLQQWEIEYALRNLRLEIVIHNSVYITSEDTLNNMSKAH